MLEAQHSSLSAGTKRLFPGHAIQPVGHIGDEAGDLGHGIGLLERPVNDFHDFVIIPREPVVAGLELIGGHVFRPYDDRAAGVFCIVGADDPAFLFKFLVEFGPRIGDENIDGDAVDLDFFQYVDGPVENVRGVGVKTEDDPPVHHNAAIVETRDVVLEAIDPVEALVRLGKGIGGHGLDPHKDADAARFCSQQEQFIVLPEEHVGLHKEFLFMEDHRREKLFRKHFIGREVVVKERNDVITGSMDIGDDMIDGPRPEAVAVDISRGTKRTGMGAAPCRLDGVERKVSGGVKQVQPGPVQFCQVNRLWGSVDSPHLPGHGIGNDLRPHLLSLSHHNRIGMKQSFPRHDRGVHAAQDDGDMPLPIMIRDFVGSIGPEHLVRDPHEIGTIVQADLLDPFVLNGNVVPFGSGRGHRREGKGHDLGPS